MNRLPAVITAITRNDALCFVETRAGGIAFGLLLFDLQPELREESKVWLLFKESEVAVANGPCGMTSFSNVFSARVNAIRQGVILSQVTLECPAGVMDSLFTTRALERMKLAAGTTVTAMIKASQIALEARHDD